MPVQRKANNLLRGQKSILFQFVHHWLWDDCLTGYRSSRAAPSASSRRPWPSWLCPSGSVRSRAPPQAWFTTAPQLWWQKTPTRSGWCDCVRYVDAVFSPELRAASQGQLMVWIPPLGRCTRHVCVRASWCHTFTVKLCISSGGWSPSRLQE